MPDNGEKLAAQAALMLPGLVGIDFADPSRHYALMAGEDSSAMVPGRAAEFSAGRHAARRAMLRLGVAPQALPQGQDRAPIWPEGLVGSITHSPHACIAAVSQDLQGIGVDIEVNEPLVEDLSSLIVTSGDQVVTGLEADPALMLFCAKEAVYKAQYARSHRMFGPEALAVRLKGESFVARFLEPAAPFAIGDEVEGRITLCAGHILATAWLP